MSQCRAYEIAISAFMFDSDSGFAIFLAYFERPMLHIASNVLIIHFAANETLSIEYSVFGIGVEGILSAIADTKINEYLPSRQSIKNCHTVFPHP